MGKKTQPSTSIESMVTSEGADSLFPNDTHKSDQESVSDSVKSYDQSKQNKSETGKRSSSVTATSMENVGNRL